MINLISLTNLGSPAGQSKEICMYLADGFIVQVFDKWDGPSVLRQSVHREARRYKLIGQHFKHLAVEKRDEGYVLLAGGLTLQAAKGKLNAYFHQQVEISLAANEKAGHCSDLAAAGKAGHDTDRNE